MPLAIASSSNTHPVGVVRRGGRRVAVGVRAAEEHHRPGDLLQDVAPVLGAHDRVRLAHHLVGADDLAGDVETTSAKSVVVDGDRVAGLDVDLDVAAVGGGDALDDAPDAVVDLRVRVFSLTARIVPSISAVSGIMLFVVPAVMRPTVTTAGSNTSTERVTISCSACTISQATGIGSSARYGSLAWPPLPVTVIVERVGRRHDRPAAAAQPARRQRRRDVHRERAGDRRRRAVGERRDVEQAFLEHEAGAVVALLAGLEHEQHAAGELVAVRGEQLGGADEHRRVGVVAAGVHRRRRPARRSRARCPRAAAGRPCRRAAGSSAPAGPR